MPVARFQNNFIEMFRLYPFSKIAKMVPLHWTKWHSELKIEKPLNGPSKIYSNDIS